MEKEPLPQFDIREATLDDAVNLRSMQVESWLATYPSDENGVSYQWVKDWTDDWLTTGSLDQSREVLGDVLDDPAAFYRLAEQNGEVVGFVHVATNDDKTKELEAIYTSSATFHSGLGQRLMDLANEWIDGTETTLKVAAYNERAIRFYKKNGFKLVEGSEDIYKGVIPLITMKREEKK